MTPYFTIHLSQLFQKSQLFIIFNSNLLSIKHADYSFELNPLFHFEIAEDNDKKDTSIQEV